MEEEHIITTINTQEMRGGDEKFVRYLIKILDEYGIPESQVEREYFSYLSFNVKRDGTKSSHIISQRNKGVVVKISNFPLFRRNNGTLMSRDFQSNSMTITWKEYTSQKKFEEDLERTLFDYRNRILAEDVY